MKTTAKTIITLTLAIMSIMALSVLTTGKCFSEADLTYLGNDAYVDDLGYVHSNGMYWGEDGIRHPESELELDIQEDTVPLAAFPAVVKSASDEISFPVAILSATLPEYSDDADEDVSDIGSAIWMDADGTTYTSDGWSWQYDNEGNTVNAVKTTYHTIDANGMAVASADLAWLSTVNTKLIVIREYQDSGITTISYLDAETGIEVVVAEVLNHSATLA